MNFAIPKATSVLLLAVLAATASAAPGTITATLDPPGPILVGDMFTVNCRITGYTNPTEIDGYNFRVSFPAAMFSLVAGSFGVNDAPGVDENWLRKAPQDGVGPGALPVSDFTLDSPGVVDVSVADLRVASTRGTLAADGFLYSFKLQANAQGTGTIAPSAGAGGTVLFDVNLAPAGVPAFSNATMRVLGCTNPPVIVCPSNINVWSCSNTAVVTYTVTATSVCTPNVTVVCAPPSGSPFPVGTTPVNCTATDGLGNSSSCNFLVRVIQDTLPPVIVCPSNITVWSCSNTAVVNYTVTATDDCDTNVTITCVPAGNVFPVGTTTVSCTARDDCGHTSTCAFTVRVIQDTLPPVLTCPTNLVVWTCTNGATVPYTVTATDDCDTNVTITCTPPGIVFPVGNTTVACTARDDCGNTSTCTFTVRVIQDTLPPVLTCPTNLVVWTCTNGATVPYTVTATDDCDTNVTITCTPPGNFFPVGTTTVTCVAQDDCNHASTCAFTVRVIQDTLPPVLTCPSNLVVWTCTNGATVPYTLTATDDCDTNVTITCTPPGNFFPVGTTTVTCVAQDDCNHASTCAFTVRVIQDTLPPVLTCPSNLVVWTCTNGATVPYTLTATDDCDTNVTITCTPPGNFFPIGTTTVTCVAQDDCNHASTCAFTVRVIQDTLPPVLTCPSNIVVTTCSTSAVVNYTVTATDDCDTNVTITCVPAGSVFPVGTTTVSCTALDDCGHISTCTFTVRVIQDTNQPLVLSVDPDCASNKIVVTFSEPMAPGPAGMAGNYFVIILSGGPAVTVLSATLSADGLTVCLLTTALQCDELYSLVIATNVTDRCGNRLPQTVDGYWFNCPPCPPKVAKWSQLPGYLVFTNSPNMRGGDRWSDFDWQTLMNSGSNIVQPNWVIAEDFRSDGRPILCVRWWGSYARGFEPTTAGGFFEDGFVLSFFSDSSPAATFSRPRRLLGSYVAPMAAVEVRPTPFIGWDSNRIWQYEVALADTCLDHAFQGIARPSAFLEKSNRVYWLAITAEVGHRVIPITNQMGQVIDWVQTSSGKRATNHFWGWHTSPTQRLDLSVMGHVIMPGTNWVYPPNLWQPNGPFHMEIDQAFELLTGPLVCPTPATLAISYNMSAGTVTISWGGGGFTLQSTPALLNPIDDTEWTDIGTGSPVTLPVLSGQNRFYRLLCP